MKLSFATLGCPGWTIDQIAQNAKVMGFDGVELRGIAGEHIGPNEPPEERKRIRRLFQAAGVEICCISGYSRFTVDDPRQREEDIQIARQLVDVAYDIGCPMLRVFGGAQSTQLDWNGNVQRAAAGLKRLSGHAAKKNVKIALETHDGWISGQSVKALIDAVDSPAFGICWDVANSFLVEPLEKTCEAIQKRIFHVHFKDVGRIRETGVSKLPGQGDIDLKQALQLIHSDGYRGYLSFEWEKKWEPSLADPEVAFPHYIDFCNQTMKTVGVPRG